MAKPKNPELHIDGDVSKPLLSTRSADERRNDRYEDIRLRVKPGTRDRIKRYAAQTEYKTVNAWLCALIEENLPND